MTNGSSILPDVDGRTLWVRRLRDVIALHTSDLGGEAELSEAERSLIRRSAVLTVQLERLEVEFATGDDAAPAALDVYQRVTNTLRRTLETLGLKRRPRDVTPDLDGYLAHRAKGGPRDTA